MAEAHRNAPLLPRRAVFAAFLSAICAGTTAALITIGNMSSVDSSPFQFARGTTFASGEESRLRGFLSSALSDNRIQITILAHTGSAGDEEANLSLSEERVAIARDIAIDLGISNDRITARGVGGSAPLSKREDESDRGYQSRLARLDVALQLRR